jgi:hypothetical protein
VPSEARTTCGLCANTGSATAWRTKGPLGEVDVAWTMRDTVPYIFSEQLFAISLNHMWYNPPSRSAVPPQVLSLKWQYACRSTAAAGSNRSVEQSCPRQPGLQAQPLGVQRPLSEQSPHNPALPNLTDASAIDSRSSTSNRAIKGWLSRAVSRAARGPPSNLLHRSAHILYSIYSIQ